jgi:4-hydroxy-tetrahydrodipicolinate reductase
MSLKSVEKPLRIGVAGAAGRMGRMIVTEVVRTPDCMLSGATVAENDPNRGLDVGEVAGIGRQNIILRHSSVEMFEESDVVIDFTTPTASLEHCLLAHRYNTALVIGTTGFSDKQHDMLTHHARAIPIIGAPNMSLGVNLLLAMTEQLAGLLDEDFDIEISEMHHRMKVDAPSGTALALGRAAAEGRGMKLDDIMMAAREGITGTRKSGSIGFAVSRGGDVVGDHTVMFCADGERIELTHKASSRAIYARGAIRAARWLYGRTPGLYGMRDVLGLAAVQAASARRN